MRLLGALLQVGPLSASHTAEESLQNPAFFFFFFLVTPHSMQDLSSQTRDRAHAPCPGSTES